jgi:SAM-dependent methyltransferase
MDPRDREQNADEYYAQTYDESVSDWPGEIDFYLELTQRPKSMGGAVLELACGTGRIAIRLAQHGVNVVGLDLSPEMLDVARRSSARLENVRWIEGDMRSFELSQEFDLALIPGHAFQNLNTALDQSDCLDCIKNHLRPGSLLVLHLDHMNRENVKWLGSICGEKRGVFEPEESFTHADTGRETRALRAWSYEPSTQTAIVQTIWEEVGPSGEVVNRVERDPIRLHCVFRLEMEHLLARAGYVPRAVYGDFFRGELLDDSPSMIWVAEVP